MRILIGILVLYSADAWISRAAGKQGPSAKARAYCSLWRHHAANIVLSPSPDPQAFDSFKIGCARIHRYSRENGPENETEYVMWYHGRSKDLDAALREKLPPLSTGRIGRATSRNGLVWTKDTKGSVSEDVRGVTLGLNTAEWWGFDTTHVGLGNVLLPMTTPAVMSEGGVYIMYYMGGDHQERNIAEFVDRALPENMKDASVKGMVMRIGVAVSQDGVTWGKVEGDDPSGAIVVPYDKKDRNTDHRLVPSDLPEELYCAWPEVVVNPRGPKSEGFIMFYSTMTKDDKQKCLARAVSEDGFRWFKRGICVVPDVAGGADAAGCARCCVVPNARYDTYTQSWDFEKGWTMFYEGVSSDDGKHRIMKAESPDGVKWTKVGVVFDVGSGPDAWDHGGVGSPHVIRLDDGSQRMYYTGQGVDGSTAIGIAVMSREKGVWARELANFASLVE